METKQTAVNWLFDKIIKKNGLISSEDVKQAKKMEKQQIIDAWYIGVEKEGEEHGNTFLWHRKDLAEQYYNETFNK